jgi:hypothetical protein
VICFGTEWSDACRLLFSYAEKFYIYVYPVSINVPCETQVKTYHFCVYSRGEWMTPIMHIPSDNALATRGVNIWVIDFPVIHTCNAELLSKLEDKHQGRFFSIPT